AAGALCEVDALDEGDLEPAAGGVEGGAGPGRTAADDQQVEALLSEATKVGGSPLDGLVHLGLGCGHLAPLPLSSSASALGSSMIRVLRKPPLRAPLTPSTLSPPATRQTVWRCFDSAPRSGPLERRLSSMSS